MADEVSSATSGPGLRRALGRWDLTAFGVNIVIGGGVFLLPSLVAAQFGSWSPIAIVIVGVAVLCIAMSYAEVGSRFDGTGGPYLYTLAAFGPFVAFEVAWMSWFTRVVSQAALVNGLALALGYYAPALGAGLPRAAFVTAMLLVLALINIRGIRQGALFINTLTIAKLVPVLTLIAVGLPFIDPSRLVPLAAPGVSQWGTGALLIIYAYGGYEVMGVPAGETRNPRTDLAFAMATTVALAAVIYLLIQIITMSILPDLPGSKTPLADTAAILLGPAGALMVGVGSMLAITGNVTGSMIGASRFLFALAETRAIPRVFGRVHPRFRTPALAIAFSAAVALVLALWGGFLLLSVASAISRLLTYAGVSAAALVLRHPRFATRVAPAAYVVPFGPAVPVVAIVVSLTIVAGATLPQLAVGGGALVVGALLYLATRGFSGRAASRSAPDATLL